MTCRKRKTRCAGEKPECSTCTNNGHPCAGYSDFVERKKSISNKGGGEPTTVSREAAGIGGGSNRKEVPSLKQEPSDEYADDIEAEDECEEDDERRHWKSKVGGGSSKMRTASFVEGDAVSRRDSTMNHPVASGKPPGQSNDWDQDTKSQGSSSKTVRRSNYGRTSSYSEDGRSSSNRSPVQTHTESHRMPYFRYFGPTAIVPGYKQMVVNVSIHRDRRRSRGGSFSTSPTTLFPYGSINYQQHISHAETVLDTLEDLPVYDVNDSAPVHPLIANLVKTFFVHLGCNYPFLREQRFLRLLKEKSVEPILVDSMCALAARFSDLPIFTNEHDGRVTRSEYGHVFAQRAKAATVDTFPCPSVAAVQACLLMAYEGFGANQDSALWMYLGLAIRMAVDLGLQKMVGIKYQGERDPWYTRTWSRKSTDTLDGSDDNKQNDEETLSPEEQYEVEQERIDTFWAVFVLDRVISSGTGRPVTFRDDDFELALPEPSMDPVSGWPAPFPAFVQIIHLYGRVSDVLNNIRDANDLTEEKMARLGQMESDLTKMYQKLDQRLHFDAFNFQHYVKAGQGTTFILLHFWFHALIIILHRPALLSPFGSLSRTQLLPNSRELSMSSAKSIADILAFAELIDPKSFIGNPFTSQPMYIAACAFLMESVANASQPPSRETSPTPNAKSSGTQKTPGGKISSANKVQAVKHSLLATAANQNYQRCYKSLQQLQQYWGGVGYILTALDQKSKGIWDCETFTNEEWESIKVPRRSSFGRLPRFENPASPNAPPIAWSLTGTTNSPNANLTSLYQGQPSGPSASLQPPPSSAPVSAATPPGNMIYDPIRQSLPEAPSMFPPAAYPQATVSAVRYQPHGPKGRHHRSSMASGQGGGNKSSMLKYETVHPDDIDTASSSPASNESKLQILAGMSGGGGSHNIPPPPSHSYTPSSQHSSGYESSGMQSGSPNSSITDPGVHQHHNHHGGNHSHSHQNHHHQQHQGHQHVGNGGNGGYGGNNNGTPSSTSTVTSATSFQQQQQQHQGGGTSTTDFAAQHSSSFSTTTTTSAYLGGLSSIGSLNPINDIITFDSQEINFDALGLPNEMMPPWLEILPGDVLGLFEGGGSLNVPGGLFGGGGNHGGHHGGNDDGDDNNHDHHGNHGNGRNVHRRWD